MIPRGRTAVHLGTILSVLCLLSVETGAFVSNSIRLTDANPPLIVLEAKKGKKGKNKKSSKPQKSGFQWASEFKLRPYEAQALRNLASTALASFEGRTGKPLTPEVSGVADTAKALWNAPIACVIVGSPKETTTVEENDEDSTDALPLPPPGATIQYANLAALEMVGLEAGDFERFCPASATITAANLDPVDPSTIVTIDLPSEMKGDKKYEKGYQKKVIRSKNDETNADDITILKAERWVLEKSAFLDGKFVTTPLGVAYAWEEWLVGDSTVRSSGGRERTLVTASDLEAQVEEQAAFIRQLKEKHGLGNKDPEVVEAVAKLLELKDQLAATTAQ